MKKKLFFHLNLDFSSIELDERKNVIESSYIPILRLADKYDIYIEATISTLHQIKELNYTFFTDLTKHFFDNKSNFIASGRYQIIHDCYSDKVFYENIVESKLDYQEILGFVPKKWLAHEMVFSRRLLRLYAKANIKEVLIDKRSLPKSFHDYDRVKIKDLDLSLLLADSLHWQFIQDYTSGEKKTKYLNLPFKFSNHEFIYSGDAEHFGVDIGRFDHEIKQKTNFRFNRLDEFLNEINVLTIPERIRRVDLAEFLQIVYVKKQKKYNISRWVIGGRLDNQYLNAYITTGADINLSDLMSDMRTHWTGKKTLNWPPFEDYVKWLKQDVSDNVFDQFIEIESLPVFSGIAKWDHLDYSQAANFYPVSSVYSKDLNSVEMALPSTASDKNDDLKIIKKDTDSFYLEASYIDSGSYSLIRPFVFSLIVSPVEYESLSFSVDRIDWYDVKNNDESLNYPNLFNYQWLASYTGQLFVKVDGNIINFSFDLTRCWFNISFTSKVVNKEKTLVQIMFSVREPNRIQRNNYIVQHNHRSSYRLKIDYIEN